MTERRLEHLENFAIAIVIGIVTGVIAAGFNEAVIRLIQLTSPALSWHRLFYVALPLIGAGLTYVIYRSGIDRDDMGFGVGQILVELRYIKRQIIKPMGLVFNTLMSLVTLATGLTAGRFGPTVHIGASVGSFVAYRMKLKAESVRLLIGCGIGGTLASVFGLPFFAVVFVVEVIFREAVYKNVAPLLITTYASYELSATLGFSKPLLPVVSDFSGFVWTQNLILFCIGLGCFTGVLSILYIKSLEWWQVALGKIGSPHKRLFFGALLVGLSGFILSMQFDLHSGTLSLILGTTLSVGTLCLYIALHLMTTGITLGAGFVGGNFFPGIGIGAAAGVLYTKFYTLVHPVQFDAQSVGILGACAMMAGFLNAPLSSIALCAELTQSTTFVLPIILISALSTIFTQVGLKRDAFTQAVQNTIKKI